MSFFHWLTTGSSNGILLEQEKEPAISKPFLPFYSATTLQAPTFEHGCDLSRPLSWQQLADIARRANIIDEHDGKPLADKIEQSARQKITTPKYKTKDLCITAQVLCLLILFMRDCVVRALSSAGSALYALIGVDDVLAVAFGNDTEGTCICAGTAVDTVVANNISHSIAPPFIYAPSS